MDRKERIERFMCALLSNPGLTLNTKAEVFQQAKQFVEYVDAHCLPERRDTLQYFTRPKQGDNV